MANPRILIQGVGSIGGIVAAELVEAGYDITTITNNQNITNAINSNGIEIKRTSKSKIIFHQSNTLVSDLPTQQQFDIIFLIMKADHVIDAVNQSLPLLTSDGYFATFQNGIIEPMLIEKVGENKVVPVTVGFGATMHSPGVYEKTSPGGFHIGEWQGSPTSRIYELKLLLANVDEVTVSDNMQGVLWSKLAINSTINILGAITGQTLGSLLSSREVRNLFLDIYSEVVDVAHAKNITLEKVVSNPYLLYRSSDSGKITRFGKDIITRIIGRKYKDLKSSTLQSIERGRKSEIDVLNGYVVEEGKKFGVNTPQNKILTEIMHRIDTGSLQPESKNLDLILHSSIA